MGETGVLGPEDHVELIDGEIVYKMSPQKTPHAVAVWLLQKALDASFGPDFNVRVQLPMSIGENSEPEPDAVVSRGDGRRFLVNHPGPADVILLAEVSDSSLAFDRGRKAKLYGQSGVSEYWIINLLDRQVEAMTNPVEGFGYRTISLYREDETIPAPILGAQPIAVRDLLP
jgi:Uma2 family endonuclease